MKLTRSIIKNKKDKDKDKLNQGRQGRYIPVLVLLAMVWIMPGYADIAKKVEKKVKMSIDTQQETQKKQENWESEKQELRDLYDWLAMENKAMTAENQRLSQDESNRKALIISLEQQKVESLRIQRELLPFLQSTLDRLEKRIEMDAPFLQKERHIRLEKLKSAMEDIDTNIGEKYRKVMEALFVEAEYGNTIEVYQEKILVSDYEILGNILRLGRVSLLFLSLDQTSAAMFNVAQNQWIPLDKSYIPSLEAGLEITAKQRPVELISLPLGRLVSKLRSSHE
jgi:hypothetical protein